MKRKLQQRNFWFRETFLLIWQKIVWSSFKVILSRCETKKAAAWISAKISVIYWDTLYGRFNAWRTCQSGSSKQGSICRLFQALTGMTPFCYLNRCRVLNSSQMLARSSKKISEVASLCGFNSISYFNRTFLKITGMTPSSYRKEMALIQNSEI